MKDRCWNIIDASKVEPFVSEAYNHDKKLVRFSNPKKVVVIVNFSNWYIPPSEQYVIYGDNRANFWIDNKAFQKFISQTPGQLYGAPDHEYIHPRMNKNSILPHYEINIHEPVVLKVVNHRSCSGRDVYFLDRNPTIEWNENALVLVEPRYKPHPDISGGDKQYHRLRIYAFKNKKTNQTVTGNAYLTRSLHPCCTGDSSMLRLYQLSESHRQNVNCICSNILNQIDELVPTRNRTLMYGFDFMIDIDDKVRFLEVNSGDCLSVYTLSMQQFAQPDQAIELFYNDLVETYTDQIVRGMTVLVVGTGCFSKLPLFNWLESIKANVILVDKHQPDVYHQKFICEPALGTDSTEPESVFSQLNGAYIDSVVTLYEDYVYFKHQIQEKLYQHNQTPINGDPANALLRKHKHHVYRMLSVYPTDDFFETRDYNFASECQVISSPDDYQGDFPVVIKPSSGSSAYGVKVVRNKTDLVNFYKLKNINDSALIDGVGTGFHPVICITPLFLGDEYDIDIIIENGTIRFFVVTDNEPKPNDMREHGSLMPSAKLNGVESSQVARIVCKLLAKLGLTHGVYNVEFIMTSLGLKIIDVNPRPGGFYINAYISRLYGIDHFKCEVILNSRFPLVIHPLKPTHRLRGISLYSKESIPPSDFVIQLSPDHITADDVDQVATAVTIC